MMSYQPNSWRQSPGPEIGNYITPRQPVPTPPSQYWERIPG